jgi:glucokinase
MRRRPLAIGVDIGGTMVKLGIVADDGEILSQVEIPSPVHLPQKGAILSISLAASKLAAGLPPAEGHDGGRQVTAVGVGCAGLVSRDEGIVHTSPNLPLWDEAPLKELVEDETGLPAFVLNDADAFALAEARIGAAAGFSPVVALTIGTGIGGAIVADGKLWGGLHGFAGEVGHLSVDFNGPACPCGNRGCLEVFVGRRGLVGAYLQRADWRDGEIAFALAGGERNAVDPRLLAEAAGKGDRVAAGVFSEAGKILGAALVSLSNLLDPAVFVIGGGISQAGELLLGPARKTLRERAMIGEKKVAPLLPAALGVRAGVIGAGLYALDCLAPREKA